MKLSIWLKVLFLGITVSIVTSGSALLIGNYSYRNNSRTSYLNSINNTLHSIENEYTNEGYGGESVDNALTIKNYIKNIYDANPDEPSFTDRDLQYAYLKGKYVYIYGATGMGLSQEMLQFKYIYQEMVSILINARLPSDANYTYVAYYDEERQMLMYVCDCRFSNTDKTDQLLAGSHVDNIVFNPTKSGDYFEFNYLDQHTKCVPIYPNQENPGEELKPILYYFIEYDFAKVDKQVNDTLLLQGITLLITSFILVGLFALGAHFLFVRNLIKLKNNTGKFTSDLKNKSNIEVIDHKIKSSDEIGQLSSSITALEQEIINYIDVIQTETAQRERIEAELNVASKIQVEALPNKLYNDEKVSLRAYFESAKEVGGDFYDYFYLDENRIVIVISDVSGKGVPAALFMMKSMALIKTKLLSNLSLEEAMYDVNNTLLINNEAGLFVTSFVGVIDLKKEEMRFVNAGHEKPYIIRDGKVEKLNCLANFVLAGEENFAYVAEKVPFKKGDLIFLHTDGLNEAINNKEEEFGYERIMDCLSKNVYSSKDEILSVMNKALKDFVGDADRFDDVTMLTMEINLDSLSFKYDEPTYDVITEMADAFEKKFSYLPEKVRSEVNVIVDELSNNIISYEKAKKLHLEVLFILARKGLLIVFTSNGKEFNPFLKKDKFVEEYDDNMTVGGFGISIVKNISDGHSYQRIDGCNRIVIFKKIDE